MPVFYADMNARSRGEHEVHQDTRPACDFAPAMQNRLSLGTHDDCRSAVKEAIAIFVNATGCSRCCPACHTR